MGAEQPSRNRFEGGQRVGAGPCRRSGRAGQPSVAGRFRRPAAPPLAIVLVGLVASTGCQSVDKPTPADQIGPAATATTSADYPSLHSVPPRPQLSYSLQQQRAIVDGLVNDRANARYTDQVVRYRSGRSSLPPPPAPPPVVAATEPAAPAGPAEPGAAAPSQPDVTAKGAGDPGDFGNDTLGDFVDQLARDNGDQAPAAAGAEGAKSDGSGWFGWLRNLFGRADDPPRQPAAGSPAAGSPSPAAAAAMPVDAGAPAEAEAALTTLVAETRPAFQPTRAREPAADLQLAMAPGGAERRPSAADPTGPTLAASEGGVAAPSSPGGVGIAIGDGEVAIEGGAPAAAKPAPATITPATITPAAGPAAVRTAAVKPSATSTAVGTVAFAPGSAELPAGIGPQLEQVLATARTEGALIRIVGEADGAALALDRARAVAIALVRLGARAGDLEMTLARHATGDQARLLLAGPVPR